VRRIPPKESLRVSKRTCVLLAIWTVAGITVGVVGHYTFNPATNEDFLDSATLVNGFLFFVWLLGLFVIIFLSEVIALFVRERREMRAFIAEREKRGRRL
jgi:hypothetical protein